MNNLLHNIRFYILLFSCILATSLYFFITATTPPAEHVEVATQLYALVATIYLYLTLFISPLIFNFRNIPYAGTLVKARRGLGVSAFLFVLIHVRYAFFDQLGGLSGIVKLPSAYFLYVSLGAISFFILLVMFATSFDSIMRKMTYPKWKMLHKLVYLATFLITIHALMLGEHFESLWAPIPLLYAIALVILIGLEIPRFLAYCRQKLLQKTI